MATEPLKITCKLLDGRVNSTDGLFFLDSILYHAWFLKYSPEVFEGIEDKRKSKFHFGLPVRTDENNRYMASCGFYKQYAAGIEYWNKRGDFIDYIDFSNAKGKIDISCGKFKLYHMPQVIRTIGDVEFYCVGTKEKVEDLLSYIPAIGKKPAAGYGMVKEWIVESVEEDNSTYGKYGLMRPMPLKECELSGYEIRQCAIKPPSWKIKNQTVCHIPGVAIDEYQ